MNKQTQEKLEELVGRVKVVRRKLVTEAVLRIAAICLVYVMLYVGVYAWLDHKINFAGPGRIVALGGLAGGLIFLLFNLTKYLASHMSCSRAANYIESKIEFDQQLVTAIEYHENSEDYPYSKTLAEQLVLQVDRAAADSEFRSTVSKWLSFIFLAVIVFGLMVAILFLRDNYVYFGKYLTRLTQPMADVKPLPKTSLESITTDIIAEADSPVTMAVRIEGTVPESGQLIMTTVESKADDPSQEPKEETFEMLPLKTGYDKAGKPILKVDVPFTDKGKYRYWFEAGQAKSPKHEVAIESVPKIKSISAKVTSTRNLIVKPYEEKVKGRSLDVVKGSEVVLTVDATEELSNAVVTGPNGKKTSPVITTAEQKILPFSDPNDTEQTVEPQPVNNQFRFSFVAMKEGFVEFELSSPAGVTNKKIAPLQVLIKPDEPPKFKLISPLGDYLATNVSSVPIVFEVTDDFGLESINLNFEVAGAPPDTVKIDVGEGVRKKTIEHVLELEEYDLSIGDNVLFYAGATDINTEDISKRKPAGSEIYFIEIKPYVQRWHQMKPPLPGQAKQGLKPDPKKMHVALIAVLEYTRAFLKKTWVISNKAELTDEDCSKLESISGDVKYASEQLTLIKDDPRYGFGDPEKAILQEVLDYYSISNGLLESHRAGDALVPEKKAYTILRKFIVELEKKICPPGDGAPPPPGPDAVKIEEVVHLTRFDKDKVEWELEGLADKIAEMAEEQEKLRKMFERFMENKSGKEQLAQLTSDEKSWTADEEMPESKSPKSKAQEDSQSGGDDSAKPTVDGALMPKPKSSQEDKGKDDGKEKDKKESEDKEKDKKEQDKKDGETDCPKCKAEGKSKCDCEGEGKGKGKGKGEGEGEGQGKGQGSGQGQGSGNGSGQGGGNGYANAQGNANRRNRNNIATGQDQIKMIQARQKALRRRVEQLQNRLVAMEAMQEPGSKGKFDYEKTKEQLDNATEQMDKFDKKLTEAFYAPDGGDKKLKDALKLLPIAAQGLRSAEWGLKEQFEHTKSERVAESAQALGKELAELSIAIGKEKSPMTPEELEAYLDRAETVLEVMGQWLPQEQKAVALLKGGITRKDGPGKYAMELARRFWSMSVKARKLENGIIEEEASDAKFYESENEFFEKAAEFK
ncbi:MAG: hypothetical protein K9M75_09895 [Phycisphaerae bacterium]|nr:hypothetical protein [Phycisphaerae bacterium]